MKTTRTRNGREDKERRDDGARPHEARPCRARTISLRQLSLFLSGYAVAGEFAPASPWLGEEKELVGHVPAEYHDAADLQQSFDDALRRSVHGADTVAVAYSGGLDSTVVLLRLAQLGLAGKGAAGSGRVHALHHNLVDDAGASSATLAQQTLQLNGLAVPLHVVNSADGSADGSAGSSDACAPLVGAAARGDALDSWDPRAPRLDAFPAANDAINARAAELGASVVLTGDGADELLGYPRFLRRRDALYWADAIQHWGLRGATAEAVLQRLERHNPRLATRWLLHGERPWTSASATGGVHPGGVLAPEYAAHVEQWEHDVYLPWLRTQLALLPGLAEQYAFLSMFPHDPIQATSNSNGDAVLEASPFLDAVFMGYATGINPQHKHAPVSTSQCLASPYLRSKALVCGLAPGVKLSSTTKASYARAHDETAQRAARSFPRHLVDAGVVDSRKFHSARVSAHALAAINRVDDWLGAAMGRGHSVAG